jgi:sec-independent protein translocase protein TatA
MTGVSVPLFVGGLGPLEIGIILLLIVVLFGADKIPKLARSAGEAKKEFQKASMEAEKEVKEYQAELEDDEGETGGETESSA